MTFVFFYLSEKKENGYLNCFVVCDVSDMTLGRIAVMAHNLIVICGFLNHHDFFNASLTSLSDLAQIRHFVAFFHTLTTKARLQIYKRKQKFFFFTFQLFVYILTMVCLHLTAVNLHVDYCLFYNHSSIENDVI